MRPPAGRPLAAVAILAMAAAAFLLLAQVTPPHTDSNAYFAAWNRLESTREGAVDYDALTRAFHANIDRYATHKWLYADIGYSLATWSALVAALAVLYRRTGLTGLIQTQKRPLLLATATLAACCLFWTGFVAEAVQSVQRGLVPDWADSLGIPISEACTLTLYLTPVLLLLVLAPGFGQKRSGGSIFIVRGKHVWSSALASLLYAPFVLLGVVLISSFPETGGWAYSVSGALIVWLMLNARAMAIGSEAEPS